MPATVGYGQVSGRVVESVAAEVTLLFTDIESSSRWWESHPESMRVALERHDRLLQGVIERAGGRVFKTVGDGLCSAFDSAPAAIVGAAEAQRVLAAEQWPAPIVLKVRIAVHTGSCERRAEDYLGPTVNRVARLVGIAHGGQTVLSAHTAALVEAELAGDSGLRDLGSHRLKDLGQPEHVFQLTVEGLPTEFPALRSLGNPDLANNLPQEVSSFVGREGELAAIRAALGQSRLVTLTGAGGCGKTRLALHVAAELLDGAGAGVWFVDLAPVSDPELVVTSVATAVGVREEPGRPLLETLVAALQPLSILVLLDNCEHLVEACAKVTDALLRGCAEVAILATSRESLGVDGEVTYRVPSLSVPSVGPLSADPAELAGYEAVQLFIDRAGAHRSGFTLTPDNAAAVASICRRLDGIPLALELAAARTSSLSVAEIERRLDHRFGLLTVGRRAALPRQQTLGALVDWSYDLLNLAERSVLCQVAVFAGGWYLPAAEAICELDDELFVTIADVLTSLVEKSLVHVESAADAVRYRLLETVRHYALDQAVGAGVDADRVRATHAHYFLELAETAAPYLKAAGQREWLARLEAEHDNLRTALWYLLGPGGAGVPALRMAVALREFWSMHGYYSEGAELLDAALSSPGDADLGLWSLALAGAGYMQEARADYAAARVRFEEALQIARDHDDAATAADILRGLSAIESRQNKPESALALATESVDLARSAADPYVIAHSLERRALAVMQSDPAQSHADFAESLEYYRRIGNDHRLGLTLMNLGVLELGGGDIESAREHLEAAVKINEVLHDDGMLPYLWHNLGLIAVLQHDPTSARRLFTDALHAARRSGDQFSVAYIVLGLALTASQSGETDVAGVLHGAATGLLARVGATFETLEAELRSADHERVRGVLGDEGFRASFARGEEMDSLAVADLGWVHSGLHGAQGWQQRDQSGAAHGTAHA